ncbi:hypothetical protein KC366_g4964 [Hortaea werneckii]|nr:hypothetical protein KC366_g4964 [Hortaea werneckii]
MRYDPFTLVIVLGHSGDAEGVLYLDDGESFDFQEGAYIHRRFVYTGSTSSLMSEDLATTPGRKTKDYLKTMENVRVEKIIVVGAPASWKGKTEVEVSEEQARQSSGARMVPMEWHEQVEGKASWAVVRDPGVQIGSGWKIAFA